MSAGQLAVSPGTTLEPARSSQHPVSVLLYNTDSGNEAVTLQLTPSGASAQTFFQATLAAGEHALVSNLILGPGDVLTGFAGTGAMVNYITTPLQPPVGPPEMSVYDNAGARKSKSVTATAGVGLASNEVTSALTTAGAGTLLAASIVGGEVKRTGPSAAFTDTTDTAALIIAALTSGAINQSWEFTYVNATAFTATLAGGTGVTVTSEGSGTLTVPQNSWARFLVTYSAAGAVTMKGIASGPNSPLQPAKFSTINVTTGTLAAGNASGAAFTSLTSTNATPGSQAMRTVAQVLVDTPGLAVGMSYVLRITNTGAGTLTLATDASTQFTMTGTMTVPAGTSSDFVVTINTATTGTVQQVAAGSATQPLPPAKFSTINVTTGTLAAGNASGGAFTCLTSTNATPGSQAMRTVAQVLTDTPGLFVGDSYMLRVTNTGAGAFTLATDASTQFTMTGTMTVAQNTYRDFVVTINSATTGTVQSVGISGTGAP